MTTSLKLNSTWTFYYASRKEKDHHIPYIERLIKLCEFSTLEEFFKYYLYLKPANELEKNTEIGLFKQGYQPLWESCPDSGCWLLRFKRTDDVKMVNEKWERVLLCLVSEQFDEPNMLGAVLSIRGRETIIEIWFNYFKITRIKNDVCEKFKKLVFDNKDDEETLYFKDNSQSLKDKSTLKNAETRGPDNPRKLSFK